MMDAMHSGRDEYARDYALDADGKFHIRVVKQNRDEERVLPQRQGVWCHANGDNLRRSPWDRHRQLAEMKSQCGRRIQIEVDVVHEMKPPQPRYSVYEHVPHVQRVIEQDDSERDVQRSRQFPRIEDSQPASLDETCKRLNDGPLQQIDRRRGQAGKHQVARHSTELRLVLMPERAPALERREHHKCPEDNQTSEPPDATHGIQAGAVTCRGSGLPDDGNKVVRARRASSTTSGAVVKVAAATSNRSNASADASTLSASSAGSGGSGMWRITPD